MMKNRCEKHYGSLTSADYEAQEKYDLLLSPMHQLGSLLLQLPNKPSLGIFLN